jgi:hypothetical protein
METMGGGKKITLHNRQKVNHVYPVNICFDSLKSAATVLLKENQQLLNVIA